MVFINLAFDPVGPRKKKKRPLEFGASQLVLPASMMPPTPFVHPTFSTRLTFYMLPVAFIRRPVDMLYFPLGQHILDYEPPRMFVIPYFATFDGFADPYNHMLHYNQAMILNSGNDRLFCKVFPASFSGACVSLVP